MARRGHLSFPGARPGSITPHLRHTTASLLKKLRVPPRDAQMILGHAHISSTTQIYTHVDQEARDDAVASLNKLLGGGQ